MLEELFDLSQRFIENYNRDYHRYFLKKYPLEKPGKIFLNNTNLVIWIFVLILNGILPAPGDRLRARQE